MRIRKRPARPAQQQEQETPPRYGFPSWFKQEHDEQKQQQNRKQLLGVGKDAKSYTNRSGTGKEQVQGLLPASATTPTAQQESCGGLLHCRSEGAVEEKCKAECPIRAGDDIAGNAASAGDGINEPPLLPSTAEADEAIGEEPRTPPPFCGEKPALPRHKEKEHQHQRQKARHEEGQQQLGCSCGKKLQKQQIEDEEQVVVLRRDSFAAAKTRSNKARKRMRMQQLNTPRASRDQHPQDTAESSERLSHDNGEPQQRLDEEDGSSGGFRHRSQGNNPGNGAQQQLGDRYSSYLEDVNDMGPLLRAVHSVISEAGSEGLTAREAADRVLSRGLLPEADIPRSVKMAKAMRESPYLVEVGKSSKFVTWSTFLEESSKKKIGNGNAAAGGGGGASASVPRKGKRQRTASAAASSRKSKREEDQEEAQEQQEARDIDMNEIAVCQEQAAQCAATLCQWQFEEQAESYDRKEVAVVAAVPGGGRRLALDLNVAPDEEE